MHGFRVAFRVGCQIRSTVIVGVYQKALRQSIHAKGEATTGKVSP